jgi:hypothetical protein
MSCRTAQLFRGVCALCVVMLMSAAALADVPGPGPRPHPPQPVPNPQPQGTAVPLVIRTDPNARQAILKIPKKLLPADAAAFDEPQPAGPGAARSVIAGIALSCGIAGLFLIRRDRKTRTAVVIFVCIGALAMAGQLMADLAPPGGGKPHGRPPVRPQPVAQSSGKVIIKVTDDGDAVTLILAGNAAGQTRGQTPTEDLKDAATTPPASAAPATPPVSAAPAPATQSPK